MGTLQDGKTEFLAGGNQDVVPGLCVAPSAQCCCGLPHSVPPAFSPGPFSRRVTEAWGGDTDTQDPSGVGRRALGTPSPISVLGSCGSGTPHTWPSWDQKEGSGNPQSHQEDFLASGETGYPSCTPLGQACHLVFAQVLLEGATWGPASRTGPSGAEGQGLKSWDVACVGPWGRC